MALGLSLRLFGHGNGDIDRVKIPIDPQVAADVDDDWITGNSFAETAFLSKAVLSARKPEI